MVYLRSIHYGDRWQYPMKLKLNQVHFVRMDIEEVISQNQSENASSAPLSTPALTFDVIIEILTWLPVMALLRFKTVCKEWKAIIETENFIFKHYNRSLPCVVKERQHEYPGLELMIRDIYQCLGIYYGMIVERGVFRKKYRIRNPATRRVIELPDPHEGVFGMFLYHLSSSGDFKLISLYDTDKEAGNGCQILSLDGSDNPSWRPLTIPNLHELGWRIWNIKFVFIGQVVHCVVVASNDSEMFLHVMSLDIEKEGFIGMITPHVCFSDLMEAKPFQYNGELAFAEIVKEGLQVYTLEADDDKKLVKKVVLPLLFLKKNPEMMEDLVIFGVRGSEVWFNWSERKLFIYDTELGRITCSKALVQLERYAFPLKPSLFAIKRMGPTKRITPNRYTQVPRV